MAREHDDEKVPKETKMKHEERGRERKRGETKWEERRARQTRRPFLLLHVAFPQKNIKTHPDEKHGEESNSNSREHRVGGVV
jgi:hypothetical protein